MFLFEFLDGFVFEFEDVVVVLFCFVGDSADGLLLLAFHSHLLLFEIGVFPLQLVEVLLQLVELLLGGLVIGFLELGHVFWFLEVGKGC